MGKSKEKDFMKESVMCKMYDISSGKTYPQSLRRENLLDRTVIFETDKKEKCIGTIKGFFDNDAGGISMMVYNKDGKIPAPESDIMVVKGTVR